MQFELKYVPQNVGKFIKNPGKFFKMVARYSKLWEVPQNFGKFEKSAKFLIKYL
jgi:hypothetical protein